MANILLVPGKCLFGVQKDFSQEADSPELLSTSLSHSARYHRHVSLSWQLALTQQATWATSALHNSCVEMLLFYSFSLSLRSSNSVEERVNFVVQTQYIHRTKMKMPTACKWYDPPLTCTPGTCTEASHWVEPACRQGDLSSYQLCISKQLNERVSRSLTWSLSNYRSPLCLTKKKHITVNIFFRKDSLANLLTVSWFELERETVAAIALSYAKY